MKADIKKYAVPALDKGLDILEYLTDQITSKTQTEIASGIGRSANEIYRVLVNLEARGYIMRDELSGRYYLSFKLYNLSRSISPIDHVRQCALPHMEDLAVKTGQSCHLNMLYQSQTMVIVQARSHAAVSMNVTEGFTCSTINNASGLVLLANSNEEVRTMILERDATYLKMSKRKRKLLADLLEGIKKEGVYVANNDSAAGVCDVTALIGQSEGKVIASLTICAITNNIESLNGESELVGHVIETAHKITRQLGC